ncbi:MAG: hypothetical protein AAB606_00445 [Patescibacteria group bacterium]
MFKPSRTIKFTVSAVLICFVVLVGVAEAATKKNKTGCTGSVQSSGFIKSYNFKDSNLANSVSLTSDGGYALTGGAIINKYMSDGDAFIMKVNSEGKKEWANLIQTKNNITVDPLADKAGNDRGHAVTQLSDGSYILAGETNGFLNDELFEKQEFSGDVLISKFDAGGRHIWTETLRGLSLDIPVNIIADESGGFFLSAAVAEVGYEGADFLHHFVIGKFDGSGKKLWIKKTNLLSWNPLISDTKLNQSFLKDSDDNLLLTGMTEIPRENSEEGDKSDSAEKPIKDKLAIIVKLNSNGETIWTKSLEGIPARIKGADYRVRAGSFYAVEQTEDKGYAIFGLLYPIITGEPRAKVAEPTFLAAIKLDKDGDLIWAKAVGIGAPLTGFFTTKTKDNGFVFIKNYKAWNNKSDEDFNNYVKAQKNAQKKQKKSESESDLGIDIEKQTIDLTEKADVNLNKILAIKTDRDFNVQWVKKIGIGKEFLGFDVKATPDQGVAIAGLHRKSTVREVTNGQTFTYDDALLVKLDVNGNAGAPAEREGLISDYSAISAEDVSAYIKVADFTSEIKNYDELVINQQNPEILPTDIRTNDLCAFRNYETAICPLKSQAKTWAQVNFKNTKEIAGVAKGKSQEVHDEILPILKRVFKGVKVIDNIGGFSMEYTVSRLVTQKDIDAVQKELEALGYTTYEKDTDQLIMKKIGRMLVVGFSTNDRLRGIITVSF